MLRLSASRGSVTIPSSLFLDTSGGDFLTLDKQLTSPPAEAGSPIVLSRSLNTMILCTMVLCRQWKQSTYFGPGKAFCYLVVFLTLLNNVFRSPRERTSPGRDSPGGGREVHQLCAPEGTLGIRAECRRSGDSSSTLRSTTTLATRSRYVIRSSVRPDCRKRMTLPPQRKPPQTAVRESHLP